MKELHKQLAQAGVRQRRIAEATGLSEAEVSRQLHGIRPLSPGVERAALRLISEGRRDLARRGLEVALTMIGPADRGG